MTKFLSNKATAMAVIALSFALAMHGELILGPALFYVYFLVVILIAAKAYGSFSAGFKPFVAVIVFGSLFMVPALYGGISEMRPDADILATRETYAPKLCPDYFKSSGWERYVQRRNTSWCRDYPQYDVAAQKIDNGSTASTETTGNLWK
ncbi:hypothetical protein HFN60_30055 [Rhizobium leguminosarum]|uniref:hypothetical protein n=1 Tax=Rhizobium leguminosarum TaxID=384 RepID=UPI001C9883A5|nr:hypothetical protein [Rhizobium leguminosarum]MBY5819839.1 hypothetical protein [Rhizobium leguminosarum]